MTQTGIVYGQALYSLAKEESCTDAMLKELAVLNHSFRQEPKFVRLLSAPNLPKEERCQILDVTFRDKINPYLLNFLKILTEKGYMRHFDDCCKVFRQKFNEDHGILEVCAVTAIPLTPDQSRRLAEKLTKVTGKTVDLQNRVDPACLGGVRLDYDGKRMDDTVSLRLESIGKLLKNTVL